MQMSELVGPWLESNRIVNPLVTAIERLTQDKSIALEAQKMRDAHLSTTGTELAADHIETWLKTGAEAFCRATSSSHPK